VDRKNDVNRVIGLAERSPAAEMAPATSGVSPAAAGSRLIDSPCTSTVDGDRPTVSRHHLGIQRRGGLVGGQPTDVDAGDADATLYLAAGDEEVDDVHRSEREQHGADPDDQ